MSSLQRLLAFCAIGFSLLVANAFAQDAKILRIVGNAAAATITKPGQAPAPVTQDMAIAQNDTLTTGAGVELYVQTYPGAIATIKANTTVVMERLVTNAATLNLRQGDLVSQIDPARNSDYQVRTARGVAAARGTSFVVTINNQQYTVATTSGGVNVTPVGGGTPVFVGSGAASVNNQGSVPLGSLPAAQQGNIAAAALAAVAVVKESGALPNSQALLNDTAAAVVATGNTAVIAQATAAAAVAAPSQAAQVVTAAITGAGANAANIATTVTQAAAQGVGQAAAETAAKTNTSTTATSGDKNAANTTATTTAATQAGDIAKAAAAALGVAANSPAAAQLANVATGGTTAGLTSTAIPGNALATPGSNVTAAVRNQVSDTTGIAQNQIQNAPQNALPTSPLVTPQQQPGVGNIPTTPITPIDPTINVSPSGTNP